MCVPRVTKHMKKKCMSFLAAFKWMHSSFDTHTAQEFKIALEKLVREVHGQCIYAVCLQKEQTRGVHGLLSPTSAAKADGVPSKSACAEFVLSSLQEPLRDWIRDISDVDHFAVLRCLMEVRVSAAYLAHTNSFLGYLCFPRLPESDYALISLCFEPPLCVVHRLGLRSVLHGCKSISTCFRSQLSTM